MSATVYPVDAGFAAKAWIDDAKYQALYRRSVEDPNGFWAEQARRIDWIKPPTKIKNTTFGPGTVAIRWYEDGVLNASANCLDRHLAKRGGQTAILWEGDDPKESRHITYRELHEMTCRLANAMKALGIKKGDRVTIYLPMVPEAAAALLACARIGAIHSVVFGGFSPDSLVGRIQDCDSNLVITADEGLRGGRKVPLKANVDEALKKCPTIKNVIVLKRTGGAVPWQAGRDHWWHEVVGKAAPNCPPEPMGAEDPLFILYTSGSTGKPKGVLHTTGGYMVYASLTHQYVFDYRDGEVYWCTADVGWVTGHTYIVYGPLANGAVSLMFEGIPNYPSPSRFWEVVDKHKVSIFYTAPTAIRALMREGEAPVARTSRKSLRLLGSVGEPINPEAWVWYWKVIGGGRCPVVDTWWQTETGHILISPLPGVTVCKPGSATFPFPGVEADVVNDKGESVDAGYLVIKRPWPGMLRGIYGDPERYQRQYWSQIPGVYFTGDGAKRDRDGYLWLLGRIDDVMNVSGHRVSTMEVESALVDHPAVAEAAVIGRTHEIKGQAIAAFVTIKAGIPQTEELRQAVKEHVAKKIGALARPDDVIYAAELPKTRSGKIMRRLLRDVAEGRALGDTTTLADAGVVAELKQRYEDKEG